MWVWFNNELVNLRDRRLHKVPGESTPGTITVQGDDGFEYLVPCARSKKALLDQVTLVVEAEREEIQARYKERVDAALDRLLQDMQALAVTQDAVDRCRVHVRSKK